MQTTVANASNINVVVINATIETNDSYPATELVFGLSCFIDPCCFSSRRALTSDVHCFLRLIVAYIYAASCTNCVRLSDEAVRNEPQIYKSIRIRNASLVNISRPVTVIYLSKAYDTTEVHHHESMTTETWSQGTSSSALVHSNTNIVPHHSTHPTTGHTNTVHHPAVHTAHTSNQPHMVT